MGSFRHLLTGHDTVECAYYLTLDHINTPLINYEELTALKEDLRRTKTHGGTPKSFGIERFVFASHGTKSGYPFLIENDAFSIQFGEFNKPNFYVTYRSHALMHHGLENMHYRFMAWAESVGLCQYAVERLSRVDFTFDYYLPDIDFDETNFASRATKDAQYRSSGMVQTFQFGRGDIGLRIYNKCAEIEEKSQKTWLFDIWKIKDNVWRIEWQIRKQELRSVGISSVESLYARQADLLKKLVNNHTTLRVKSQDNNISRWSWHPLWLDLDEVIENMPLSEIYHEFDKPAALEERRIRLTTSVYGYLKRLGAIICLRERRPEITIDEVFQYLREGVQKIHDPLTWKADVKRRVEEMELQEW